MNNRQPVHPCYGDATDGNVTLVANTTLTRDMQYDTLDLAGFSIDTDGFRIRCRKLLNSGGACSITRNGGNASGSTGGSMTGQSLGRGSNGGNGSGGGSNGSPGIARGNCWGRMRDGGTVCAGGAGGASGGGQNGGGAGTVTAPNANVGQEGPSAYFEGILSACGGVDTATSSLNNLHGGAGGGGGGATANSIGGGGGCGGGVLGVWARYVEAPSVTLTANGGQGGNGNLSTGSGAGGGGGGGGGFVLLVYQFQKTLPTLQALGGSFGTGAGTGSNGSVGTAGSTLTKQVA